MKLGISLSPGGLLFPYHLGVMDCLEHANVLQHSTPLAGSSAGAIAAATKGCGISSTTALQATIAMSDRCHALGGARGRLMPLLQDQLHQLIGDEQFEHLQQREGNVGIAYRELFPYNRPIVETDFATSCALKRAVCHSSSFPFFTTNWPVALDWSKTTTRSSRSRRRRSSSSSAPTKTLQEEQEAEEAIEKSALTTTATRSSSSLVDFDFDFNIPRVVVDGYFTVPRARFGCPDLDMMNAAQVDRTICVSVFPQDLIGMTAVSAEDCISPQCGESSTGGVDELQRLLRLATQASSAKELTQVYEDGWKDAERWCRAEHDRRAAAAKQQQEQVRRARLLIGENALN
jgi:hypothetical protein